MNWKQVYTLAVLSEMDKDISTESVQKHLKLWWMNRRDRGKKGLRLTNEGLEAMHLAGISVYEVEYPPEMMMTPQTMLFLDKFLDCPYYLKDHSIVVLDAKRAVELIMYSGNVKKFGEAYARDTAKKLRLIRQVKAEVFRSQSITCKEFKRQFMKSQGRQVLSLIPRDN